VHADPGAPPDERRDHAVPDARVQRPCAGLVIPGAQDEVRLTVDD
jgi:hypothetical protein